MSLREEYALPARVSHEVRILLALVDLEERDGPDATGMLRYQMDRVYETLAEMEKPS